MGDIRSEYTVFAIKPDGKRLLATLGANERVILKLILKK
jgi:hypothetical protein